MLILNDIHLGVQRSGGTTPASREALRSYLFGAFKATLDNSNQTHLCILGDLFDTFEVEGRDWVECYMILSGWLNRYPDLRFLTLVAGNHDHSPKAQRVSSFEMLCRVLNEQFGPEQVKVVGIDAGAEIEPNIHALAHCSNQDIFNLRLTDLLGLVKVGDRVLLHANYDNHFAVESDHSLNVSTEQTAEFMKKEVSIYFAHEHQARTILWKTAAMGATESRSQVGTYVFGNQWPTSVSDCLNNDAKYAHVMDGGITKVPTWARSSTAGYAEIPWRDLGAWNESGQDPGFIKIVGTASSNEAGDCISAIAKFRTRSSAFVITNGVKIEGIADNEALPEAFEATKAFDVVQFIMSNLDEPQQRAVDKLLGVQS